MVWLYRSPVTGGGRGYLPVQIISTCLTLFSSLVFPTWNAPLIFTGGIKQGGLKNRSRSEYMWADESWGWVDDGRDYLTK
jgi:hypothetical protein